MVGLRVLRIVEAQAEQSQAAVVLRWVSVALFFLAALATVLAVTGIVLERRAERLRSDGDAGVGAVSTAGADLADRQATQPVRLVVVDPVTILYGQSLNVEVYLLPFIRDQQGTARTDTVLDACKSLRSGLIDSAGLWERCGLTGSTLELDERYVATRTMTVEARAFLEEMQRRRIPVAAVSHDVETWSELTRTGDNLSAVWPWLVSSPGGATSPTTVFRALHRESGVDYEHCLYVDTRIAHLDAASHVGMKTALLDSGTIDLPADTTHAIVTDLDDLLDL